MPSGWQKLKRSIFPENTHIFAAAPTQKISTEKLAGQVSPPPPVYTTDSEKSDPLFLVEEISSSPADITSTTKPNVFDKITRAAGSSGTFFFMIVMLGFWAVTGVVYGTTDTWQIILQNASSIQVYVTDILLIRQHANASRTLMTTLAEIQSRNLTCERLLLQIPGCQWMDTHAGDCKEHFDHPIEEGEASLAMIQGEQTWWQRTWSKSCYYVAATLGSLWAFIIYWIGIFVWVGIGPLFQFDDTWQLYINTATAISLTFTSVFLQNVQQQQEDRLKACLDYALKIDAEIEHRLRELTNDTKPNPIFEIPARTPNWIERSIDRFADIMGSVLSVLISLAAAGIWLSVGPLLQFGDDWWLIIGTFTGLVGFIDGFVLRNLYMRSERSTKSEFRLISLSDSKILSRLNITLSPPPSRPRSFSTRISVWVGDVCGSQWASVSAVGFVVALLVIATAMLWSTTGQLLCNTSTMIVEGFLLLVLIQAHNSANVERGVDFKGLLRRRMVLDGFVREKAREDWI